MLSECQFVFLACIVVNRSNLDRKCQHRDYRHSYYKRLCKGIRLIDVLFDAVGTCGLEKNHDIGKALFAVLLNLDALSLIQKVEPTELIRNLECHMLC